MGLVGHPQLSEVVRKQQTANAWRNEMNQYAWVIFTSTIGSIVVEGSFAKVRSHAMECLCSNGKRRRDVYGRYVDLLVKRVSVVE